MAYCIPRDTITQPKNRRAAKRACLKSLFCHAPDTLSRPGKAVASRGVLAYNAVMKISRLLLATALVAATCAAPFLSAADPATEARLLEALRQRLAEDPAAPAATPAPVTRVVPAATPAPAMTATPAAAVTVEDDAVTQRLREAVRQRAAAVESQSPGGVPASSPSADQLSDAVRQRMAAEPASPTAAASPRGVQIQTVEEAVAAAEARQREAEARRLADEARRAGRAARPAASRVAQSAPSVTAAAPTGLQPVPLAVPDSPLPTTKAQQLAELLERYKADAISPQEYHAERARILAQ